MGFRIIYSISGDLHMHGYGRRLQCGRPLYRVHFFNTVLYCMRRGLLVLRVLRTQKWHLLHSVHARKTINRFYRFLCRFMCRFVPTLALYVRLCTRTTTSSRRIPHSICLSLYSPDNHLVRNMQFVVPVVAHRLIPTFIVRDHPWYFTGSVY